MTDKVPAKERALNPERITRIGREIATALPAFDMDAFVTDVSADLPDLELKARITRVAQGMHDHLPVHGQEALDALLRSLPPTPHDAGISNDFGTHIYSPHSEYVARYCRTTEFLPQAPDALRRFTSYFSAEDAVRYFLTDFPEETMKAVHRWTRDDDYRVRRLASESTRPLLPWSIRVNLTPEETIPVLDHLYADASRYVIQSVANHLRDIAASNPDLALTTLARWKSEQRADPQRFGFVAREALKTRLKQGWSPAYDFLGFATDATVELAALKLEETELSDGDTLRFTVEIVSPVTAQLQVMYDISANTMKGQARTRTYFFARTTTRPNQPLALTKEHPLRSTATTRITPGDYSLTIQVNGHRFQPARFQVVPR